MNESVARTEFSHPTGFAACSAARPRGPHSCREDGESGRVFRARQRDPPSRQHADRPLARRRPRSPPSGGSPVGRGRSRGDYRSDLWHRLVRRLRALYLIVYGTRQEAEQAGATVQAVHAQIRGVTRQSLGRFPAGTPYSASEAELMMWVHATLVHASLAAYEGFAEELSPEEERYYRRWHSPPGSSGHRLRSSPDHWTSFASTSASRLRAVPSALPPGTRGRLGDPRGAAAGTATPARPCAPSVHRGTAPTEAPRRLRAALDLWGA